VLEGIVAVDDDDRPIEKPEHVVRLTAKLTEALAQ
jgi:hypothetical protein